MWTMLYTECKEGHGVWAGKGSGFGSFAEQLLKEILAWLEKVGHWP